MNDRLPKLYSPQVKPASERQIKFIRDLIDRKDLLKSPKHFDEVNAMDKEEYARHLDGLKDKAATLDCSKASAWIDNLLKLPDKERERRGNDADLPDVPEGRYAVENDEGELRFYTYDRPRHGYWAGRTFLSVLASDERIAIKGHAAKATILQKILDAGVYEAMVRFGHEIGVCGNCGRTLTNRISRELGIGPVCGGRILGDEFKPIRKAAKDRLLEQGLDPNEEVVADESTPEDVRPDDDYMGNGPPGPPPVDDGDRPEQHDTRLSGGQQFEADMEAMHRNGKTGLDHRQAAVARLAASPNATGSTLDQRFGSEAPF